MNIPRTRIVSVLLGVLCSMTATSWALDRPHASPKDQRIRWTAYDAADVIQIDTTLGIATQIQLNDDEDYVTHAFGDSAAYDFQQIGKHLLLKPVVDQADTNLLYITTRRNYSFLLKFAKDRQGKELHRLVLRYPDIEYAKTAAGVETLRMQQAFESKPATVNWQSYAMSGDTDIAPQAVWDDGAQTWMRFAAGKDLPTVYLVDPDGQEVIANRTMEGERTIVLHRVAARWHARLGGKVVAIHNDATDHIRSLPNGTVSPAVERVLREEDPS